MLDSLIASPSHRNVLMYDVIAVYDTFLWRHETLAGVIYTTSLKHLEGIIRKGGLCDVGRWLKHTGTEVCCVKQIFLPDCFAGPLLLHMWAHEGQGERIIWPAWGWVSVLSAVLKPHGHMVGTEGGVWALSEILIEASLCLCQEVQEYPCLLMCLLGSPSLYLCQLHVHVCLCEVFTFAHVLLITACICKCVCVVLTRKKNPGSIVYLYLMYI